MIWVHIGHAHNTEDMEIAYRMQKYHYKIEQCNDAYVYTNTPSTIMKLYKQGYAGYMVLWTILWTIAMWFFEKKIWKFCIVYHTVRVSCLFFQSVIFLGDCFIMWPIFYTRRLYSFNVLGFNLGIHHYCGWSLFYKYFQSIVFLIPLLYFS